MIKLKRIQKTNGQYLMTLAIGSTVSDFKIQNFDVLCSIMKTFNFTAADIKAATN